MVARDPWKVMAPEWAPRLWEITQMIFQRPDLLWRSFNLWLQWQTSSKQEHTTTKKTKTKKKSQPYIPYWLTPRIPPISLLVEYSRFTIYPTLAVVFTAWSHQPWTSLSFLPHKLLPPAYCVCPIHFPNLDSWSSHYLLICLSWSTLARIWGWEKNPQF